MPPTMTFSIISELFAKTSVSDTDDKEADERKDEDQIVHGFLEVDGSLETP